MQSTNEKAPDTDGTVDTHAYKQHGSCREGCNKHVAQVISLHDITHYPTSGVNV